MLTPTLMAVIQKTPLAFLIKQQYNVCMKITPPENTLKHTADRIIAGTLPVVAIKEHVDAWNKGFDAMLFLREPVLTGIAHVDIWLAAAAEYEAYAIEFECPAWANKAFRFSKEPIFFGGKNSRIIALTETPSAFRRRLLFCGMPSLKVAL
jgi:hypothetical protein